MIVIHGRPATKKNSGRIVRIGNYPRLLPSKAFEKFEKVALKELSTCRDYYPGAIAVCFKYWLPDRRWWPDLVGLLQATSDILQKANIISDDQNISGYGNSRIVGIDKNNPRTEIEIWEWV